MSRGYSKVYNRKLSAVSQTSIQFDKLFHENSNRPSAAKSAGTVGKWGVISCTSLRSTNFNGKFSCNGCKVENLLIKILCSLQLETIREISVKINKIACVNASGYKLQNFSYSLGVLIYRVDIYVFLQVEEMKFLVTRE